MVEATQTQSERFCSQCPASLIGMRTDAVTCGEVCRKRAQRPQRRTTVYDFTDHLRVLDSAVTLNKIERPKFHHQKRVLDIPTKKRGDLETTFCKDETESRAVALQSLFENGDPASQDGRTGGGSGWRVKTFSFARYENAKAAHVRSSVARKSHTSFDEKNFQYDWVEDRRARKQRGLPPYGEQMSWVSGVMWATIWPACLELIRDSKPWPDHFAYYGGA
jgi:hypothetical protein